MLLLKKKLCGIRTILAYMEVRVFMCPAADYGAGTAVRCYVYAFWRGFFPKACSLGIESVTDVASTVKKKKLQQLNLKLKLSCMP